jgi:very-short-patch-repair endonuclease
MTRVYNRTAEKEYRRALRAEMPRAEVLLWSKLRGRQLSELKFRRQCSVGPYVVDFYCPQMKLAVEIDGDSHFGDGAEQRDARRQTYIESFGIRFVRCTNGDV